MSLPAETKFPCALTPQRDSVIFQWFRQHMVSVETAGLGEQPVMLDRSQVESLRDQLSEWLAETGDA